VLFRARVLGKPESQLVALQVDWHAQFGEVADTAYMVVVQVGDPDRHDLVHGDTCCGESLLERLAWARQDRLDVGVTSVEAPVERFVAN
jgi:hypothetical protein